MGSLVMFQGDSNTTDRSGGNQEPEQRTESKQAPHRPSPRGEESSSCRTIAHTRHGAIRLET